MAVFSWFGRSAIVAGVMLARSVVAQLPGPLVELADRGPTFYRSSADGPVAVDVRTVAVLQQRIALDLDDTPLPDAIAAVSRAAGVPIFYGAADVSASHRVTLQATKITVAGALTAILVDAGVDVHLSRNGALALARRGGPSIAKRQQGTGTITGQVTDAKTGAPLSDVVIAVSGTSIAARSGPEGRYTLHQVPAGEAVITFRHLGYLQAARAVTVADTVMHLDVAVEQSPAVLDQVVTTVTGNQQLRTIGNSIATINADSLVPTTPVTDFADLINGRAPGVQVINAGGLTGASPVVYARGRGSLMESTQPLLYVDGVRVTNSFATLPNGGPGAASGGFNDLIPEDIQSIEIVKGPSAATLYGTDAANGVILVTTKRGETGTPRWHLYGEGGVLTENPDVIPYNYTGWGRDSSGNVINSCTLLALASGSCAHQDSVTKFNPIRVPSLTPLGTGNRAQFGADVSGGAKGIRYFVSGDYTSEVGPLKDPVADQRILDSLLGAFAGSGDIRHPNAVGKYDGRVNLTTPLGSNADVTLSGNYLSQTSHIPSTSITLNSAGGAGYRDACDGWLFCERPAEALATAITDQEQHTTAGATAHWVPTGWLSARATGGVDALDDAYLEVQPAAAAPVTFTTGGEVFDRRATTTLYSLDLGATARWALASGVVSNTSLGAQYHRADVAGATALATQLIAGGTSVGAGLPVGVEVDSERVVAGAYAEEQLAINDRLFVTGAVRVDGANDFGSDFRSAVYPKGGVSWMVSREPFFPRPGWLSVWRLRGAYGESGTQPGEVLTTLQATPATIDGVRQAGLTLSTLGNPRIQPERQTEIELGSDIDLVDSRLHVELTYYRKRNVNALFDVPFGASLANASLEENVGEIVDWGYEALLSAALVAKRSVTWDVSLSGSVNHNQVVSLGPYFQPQYGPFSNTSIVAGYPAPAFFAQPYTYSDANHDGILEPDEITVSPTERYAGQSIPPVQATAATAIGLFDNHVRIGAQFDYRGGFVIPDQALAVQCFVGTAAATNIRSASLASQAACLAVTSSANSFRGVMEDGSFTRFRELSLTYVVPERVAHHMNSRSVSVTLAARNLALWTRFPGGDPESAPTFLGNTAGPAYGIGSGPPATQYWLMRVNVGL